MCTVGAGVPPIVFPGFGFTVVVVGATLLVVSGCGCAVVVDPSPVVDGASGGCAPPPLQAESIRITTIEPNRRIGPRA